MIGELRRFPDPVPISYYILILICSLVEIQGLRLEPRILLHVPMLALCTFAVEHTKGSLVIDSPSSAQRDCRTLCAMAGGFFGRLGGTLPHSELLDRVTELLEVVNDG